jgi:hypothetical protein
MLLAAPIGISPSCRHHFCTHFNPIINWMPLKGPYQQEPRTSAARKQVNTARTKPSINLPIQSKPYTTHSINLTSGLKSFDACQFRRDGMFFQTCPCRGRSRRSTACTNPYFLAIPAELAQFSRSSIPELRFVFVFVRRSSFSDSDSFSLRGQRQFKMLTKEGHHARCVLQQLARRIS